MRMSADHVPAVVAEYFDSVLIPAASSHGGLLTFGTGLIGGLVSRNAAQMVEQYRPIAKSLGVIDDNNMVDIDLLYEHASKAMQRGRPSIMGYTMDQSDLDRLRDIMNRHGG